MIDPTVPAKVYWNLKRRCYSVQQRGKVVAYMDTVVLRDVVFRVSEAGRQRVLRTKEKNVHAKVQGYVGETPPAGGCVGVTYNPYRYSTFVVRDTEQPIHSARAVVLSKAEGRARIVAFV